MGKTRDLFKKIRDTKGNISCKDGLNKGQTLYGSNRAEDIKRGGKNTQKNYTKKIFMSQIVMMTPKTHLTRITGYLVLGE